MPTVQVKDIRVYYEIRGAGSPLVLIGGLGADLTLLTSITEALAQHHTVLVFDNRGVGRTDQPDRPYSIALMAEDTVGLMNALSIDSADVLGISMGGRIALEMALNHPSRVRRLVLVSTSAAGRGRITMSWPMRLMYLLQWIPGMHGKYPQPSYAHHRQRQAAVTYDAIARIRQIKQPTLILHGRRDRSIPLEAAEQLHTGIPGSRMHVFRGGHMFSLLTEKEPFIARVEDFLGARYESAAARRRSGTSAWYSG
jgi:3-oxoadipate enol-lactonase